MQQIRILVSLLCVATLLTDTEVSAADSNSEKPALPPIRFASPGDVYGNSETQKIEHDLLKLLTLAPRPAHGETSQQTRERIFAEMDDLVQHIDDPEQLERFAYWCHQAAKGPQPDSDLAVVASAFNSSLGWLQKRHPIEARARIYEIANLVNADGHVGEEIDSCLAQNPAARPDWEVVCCYVSLLKNNQYSDEYDKAQGAIKFNLTRWLRREWYPNWGGKHRYQLLCTFVLLPDGKVKDVAVQVQNFAKVPVEEALRAKSIARGILTRCCSSAHLPTSDRTNYVVVVLAD